MAIPSSFERISLSNPERYQVALPNSPLSKQTQAIARLKELFNDVTIAARIREESIEAMKGDLSAGEIESVWVLKLFEALPKNQWPFVFLSFENEICLKNCFPDCTERLEHRRRLGFPIPEQPKTTWLDDRSRWNEIAITALQNVVGNPLFACISDDGDMLVYHSLYSILQALRESETTDTILLKYLQTAEPAHIVETFDRMYPTYDQDTFTAMLGNIFTRLEKKTTRIAEIVIGNHLHPEKHPYAKVNFRIKLLQPPFLNTPQEVREVVSNILSEKEQDFFFEYFIRVRDSFDGIIKSLKDTDPNNWQQLILSWILSCCDLACPRMSVIRSLCSDCEKEGWDIASILSSDALAEVQERLKTLVLKEFTFVMTDLKILSFLDPMNFDKLLIDCLKKTLRKNRDDQAFLLSELFSDLAELKRKESFAHQLYRDKNACDQVVKYIKKHFELLFAPSTLSPFIEVIAKLVADWKERLHEMAIKKIHEEKNNPFLSHRTKLNYDQVSRILSHLKNANLLEEWVRFMEEHASEEVLSILKGLLPLLQISPEQAQQ